VAEGAVLLEIATPTGIALRMQAEWVQAPSVRGQFGVLKDHLPLLAALRCGILKASEEGKVKVVAVGPGFASVQPEKVEVLTDLFVRAEDVDVDAAKKDLEAAEAALKTSEHETDSAEHEELVRNLEWAIARIDAAAELD
jgi:F-type H+-transporting ATPase subunit epsilon